MPGLLNGTTFKDKNFPDQDYYGDMDIWGQGFFDNFRTRTERRTSEDEDEDGEQWSPKIFIMGKKPFRWINDLKSKGRSGTVDYQKSNYVSTSFRQMSKFSSDVKHYFLIGKACWDGISACHPHPRPSNNFSKTDVLGRSRLGPGPKILKNRCSQTSSSLL